MLSKDCNFKSVTASQHCDESIRDSFISGLRSASIRQRLLENKTLDSTTMFDQARSLEAAQKNSESFHSEPYRVLGAASDDVQSVVSDSCRVMAASRSSQCLKCFFCGSTRHPQLKCPAKEAVCH